MTPVSTEPVAVGSATVPSVGSRMTNLTVAPGATLKVSVSETSKDVEAESINSRRTLPDKVKAKLVTAIPETAVMT